MLVRTCCPNPDCGQTYKFDESHLGRRVACRKCGREFRLSGSVTKPFYLGTGDVSAGRVNAASVTVVAAKPLGAGTKQH
jgi:uncharacterized protein (DUF983 family)